MYQRISCHRSLSIPLEKPENLFSGISELFNQFSILARFCPYEVRRYKLLASIRSFSKLDSLLICSYFLDNSVTDGTIVRTTVLLISLSPLLLTVMSILVARKG